MKPIRSASSSAFTTSMPPTMSLCPFRYLVVECSTTSAPSSRGRWKQGVAKVLSTTHSAPAPRAIAATACRSHSRIIGLVGVSAYTMRSEEHTSELQSRSDLVCRLLLEKKKKQENSMMREQAV